MIAQTVRLPGLFSGVSVVVIVALLLLRRLVGLLPLPRRRAAPRSLVVRFSKENPHGEQDHTSISESFAR